MFARVLYIGSTPCHEADFGYRIQEVLVRAGHALCVCERPNESEGVATALSSMISAFRPTLVLWDVTTAIDNAASYDFGCPVAALAFSDAAGFDVSVVDFVCAVGDGFGAGCEVPVFRIPSMPDSAYEKALVSDASASKEGILLRGDLPCDLLRILGEKSPLPLMRLSDEGGARGSNDAYTARIAKYALCAEGVSASERSMRACEGSLVLRLGEDGLEGAEDVLRRIESYEGDEREFERALRSQRLLYAEVAPLEESLPMLLEQVDRYCGGRVLAFEDAARFFTLYGWFGASNYGDDLLMHLAVFRLGARYPNAVFNVLGANAHALRCEFGFEGAELCNKRLALRFLRRSSALVFLGGLIFDQPMAWSAGELEPFLDPGIDPSGQAAACAMARMNGVPQVFLGIGAGPVELPATRGSVNLMGCLGARFFPRDEATKRCLLSAGVPEGQVEVFADLAFGSKGYVDEHKASDWMLEPSSYFVVSLRRWHQNPVGFSEALAGELDRVVDETRLIPVFLPFHKDDPAIHQEVVARMWHGDAAHVILRRPAEDELLACVCGSAFAVAMRLHCSVLHHVLGKPAVGLSYNEKIAAHFECVGQERFCVPLGFEAGAVASAVHEALQGSWDATRLTEIVHAGAAEVDREFGQLFSIIDARVPPARAREVFYPRYISMQEMHGIEETLRVRAEYEGRVRELGEENRRLQRVVDGRIERVALGVCRGVRRLLNRPL